MLDVLIYNSTKFTDLDCFVLIQEMDNAFFAKYWSAGDTESETHSSQIATWTIGVPFAAFFMVYFHPLKMIVGYPEERTCNFRDKNAPIAVIELFERSYKHRKRGELDIPVPIVWRLSP